MGSEDEALTIQSKKNKTSHQRGKHSHQKSNFRKYKYLSKFICYTCDERGHFAKQIFLETRRTFIRRRETREDIMLMLQRMMNLPQRETNKTVMKNML